MLLFYAIMSETIVLGDSKTLFQGGSVPERKLLRRTALENVSQSPKLSWNERGEENNGKGNRKYNQYRSQRQRD